MTIKGKIFDEHGNMYDVDNVDIYVGEMKDKLLVNCYMNTIHFHEIITEDLKTLVKVGAVKKDDKDYDPTLTTNSISSMRTEVIERFGEDYNKFVLTELKLRSSKISK